MPAKAISAFVATATGSYSRGDGRVSRIPFQIARRPSSGASAQRRSARCVQEPSEAQVVFDPAVLPHRFQGFEVAGMTPRHDEHPGQVAFRRGHVSPRLE